MDKVTKIVEAAATIAKQLHEGQVDKAGEDYFSGHLTSVASMEKTWQEQVVGYLHDASEDTSHTVNEVWDMLDAELGTSLSLSDKEELGKALRLLNHHTSTDRESYICTIGANALATAVKLNDFTHNMDLSRLPNPTDKDLTREERNKQEFEHLKGLQGDGTEKI